jgi:ATP-dependent Clp protease ATP-binding subunit ClpA
MFERFTEQAIKSVMLANEEAQRLGHNFVGTEQILLGLVGQGTGVAAQVLDSMGVNLQNTRVEVEKIIGRGTGLVAAEIPFTPRAKQLLELALAEADRLSHSNIDTEHLLLSLIQIQEGVAARVLKSLGVDFAEVRTQVSIYQHYLQQQPAGERRVDRVDGNELPMTEHLTPRAIKVILLAQKESHLLGHNFIGTEHIFLGLISESSGRAAKVLQSMGVSLNKARSEVEKIMGRGTGVIPTEMPFTLRAKRAIELSRAKASQIGQKSLDPEHLLLGMIVERGSGAVRVSESLGIDLTKVYLQATQPQRHWLDWLGWWRS